ncbi:hypothetical protein GCM10027416_17800 [Okibacterium endophyticum]
MVFSHSTAAGLLGIPLPTRAAAIPLHVTSAKPHRAMDATGVVGHQSSFAVTDVEHLDGLPLTSPARTWCDLSASLDLGSLVAAGDHLLHRKHPLATPAQLLDAVERHPTRRGMRRALTALPLLTDRSDSPPESRLRVHIVLSPLPDPLPNLEYTIRRTGRKVRFDLAFPVYKVALEYQGDHHRSDVRQWRSDIARKNDVTDEGWSVIEFTADDLRDVPALLRRVEQRLRSRGWRP